MANLIKFIVLVVVAFAMGAALAWFQSSRETPTDAEQKAQIEKQIGEIKPAVVGERERKQEDIVDGAPAMPDPLDALYDDANKADDTAMQEAAPAPEEKTAETPAASAQKVAGSSVGGAFTMVDQDGKQVTEKSWPGKKKLVFFGFTHCPDVCPTALAKIGSALEALGDKAALIQPIFVTTDPKRDTSARMKEYLADYDSRIAGLTGSDAQVDHIKSIYKVYAAIAEGGDADNYIMDHSGYIYLMSENDELLEIFGSDSTGETIVQKSTPHLTSSQ